MPRPAPNAQRGNRGRLLIAQEAARLIRESGMHDIDQARRKAAARLGVHDETLWPRQALVEEVLREQQRLFDAGSQPAALFRHRDAAAQAMQFLQAFHPRLAGAVLAGTADATSPVVLHLHCDDTDAVQRFLHGQRIPAEARSWTLQLAGHPSRQRYPGWEFAADGIAFELVVLPEDALRHPPVSSDDGKPLPRATVAQLRQLMAEEPA